MQGVRGSFHPLLSMVQCFPFPGSNRVLSRFKTYFKSSYFPCHTDVRSVSFPLNPAMKSIDYHVRPPIAIVPMKPSNAFFLVCYKNMLKMDGDKVRLWLPTRAHLSIERFFLINKVMVHLHQSGGVYTCSTVICPSSETSLS